MGVDWDSHLLSPLHDVFGDEHEYRPRNGTPFTINGIFDRGYAQVAENLDGDSEINTSSPMLGVRDAEFRKLGKSQPAVSNQMVQRRFLRLSQTLVLKTHQQHRWV